MIAHNGLVGESSLRKISLEVSITSFFNTIGHNRH